MTILRHYSLQAIEEREAELGDVLAELAARVGAFAGCEKVEIFVDARDARNYVFIEHWRSADDRDAAGAMLGKSAFAPVFATLAGRPETRDLVPLAS